MSQPEIAYLEVAGRSIAYRLRMGQGPTLVFLPGYASDMDGAKALALDAFAQAHGLAMLRFDYSGTGSSGGSFEDGTLGGWLEEALHLIDHLVEGPVVLVGSSMGGWIALLMATHRPDRVAALVGIAAAPDFTDWGYTDAEKDELRAKGRLEQPNPDGPEPQVTTLRFWESGEALRLLHEPIPVDCPVRLVHGVADPEVPLDIAVRTIEKLRSADVQLLVVKGGGHRLSEPHEIEAILRSVAGMMESRCLILILVAAALAAAEPPPCPNIVTAEAFVCRAIRATAEDKPEAAAGAFEQAALASDSSNPETARLWAAAGNMWIAAGQPGKAALALDKALTGTGLQAEQRGEALLDRARAAEAQNDLKTARAKVNEAASTISEDPFFWYFSAALAIREGDAATAKSSIGRALTLAPNEALILFEAGHVAQFAGDNIGARDYWTRTVERDPNGEAGKAARDALKLLPVTLTVQPEPKR